MEHKEKYELDSIVTAKRLYNGEMITGKFNGFHLLDKSNPKSIVGVVHTFDGSYDVEPNSIETVINEDEKIRKAILALVTQSSNILSPTNQRSMIAWLEKQGKENVITNILIKAGLKTYKDGNNWCILVGDNIQDGICGFGYTIDEALFKFLKELIEKQCEQKLAWSKEDYDEIGVIACHLDNMGNEAMANSLFRIRGKYNNINPKQECAWSEEDENVFHHLKYATKQFYKDKDTIDRCYSWLKSIKERMKRE